MAGELEYTKADGLFSTDLAIVDRCVDALHSNSRPWHFYMLGDGPRAGAVFSLSFFVD